jgi:hypothetical protein
MQLTLIPHEQKVLFWTVESLISDLGTEIGHTDNRAMRQDLQERKGVLLVSDSGPAQSHVLKAAHLRR